MRRNNFKFTFNFEKKLCELKLNDYEDDITFYQAVLFNEDKKILNIEQVGFIAIQTFRPGYEPKYILSVESYRTEVVVYEIKTIDYFMKRISAEQIDRKSIINISDRFNDIRFYNKCWGVK